ncbi:MAG: hypothetical protein ACREHG_01610, partial [Candidatus Saccharimonadales bacterium]
LLDTGPSRRVIDFIDKRLPKTVKTGDVSEQRQYSRLTKLATAFLGGTVPAMALEKLEDPHRTAKHNRKFGLWTSTWLAGACAVQGAAMAEGINIASNDTKLAAGAAGIAGVAGTSRWLKVRLDRNKATRAQEAYIGGSDTTSSPQKLGLEQDQFLRVGKSKDVISAAVDYDGKTHKVPVLVPTRSLYWYNQESLAELFPGAETYFFTQVDNQPSVINAVKDVLQEQNVVITPDTDVVRQLASSLAEQEPSLEYDSLGGAYLNQYVGVVEAEGINEFKSAPDFFKQYKNAIEEGTLHEDKDNGPAITDTIRGEEADRLWDIYEKPFRDISSASPINAGFNKEVFYKLLTDKNVAKVINRKNGIITTMALFSTDLKSASWLNEEYFARNYPEAYETGNIMLF